MEVLKKPNTNLVAIYRLEFYKKQKNWKLSKDKKNKECDASGGIKNQLNKTYDVMEPKTKVCELNNGFNETGTENSLLRRRSYQLLQPFLYNYSGTTRNYQAPYNFGHSPLDYDYTKQDRPVFNVCSEKGEAQCWLDINKNGNHVPESDRVSPKDWPSAINALTWGNNVTNAHCKIEDTPPRKEHSWLQEDEDLRRLQETAYSNTEDEWDAKSKMSVDSWTEFVCGAKFVPHSSEIELNVSNVLSDVESNENSLARLSSAQFSAEVPTHARSLRHLLHENSQRQRIDSSISLTGRTRYRPEITPRAVSAFNSYDEYLTRAINHSALYMASNCKTLRHEKTSTTEDLFVAGSYKNVDLEIGLGIGKGRGRLQVAPGIDSRKGVIGIGRGRPYRL